MKNNILFFLICLFTIVNILDVVTAQKDMLAGESNPLYILFGSLWIVYVIKFILIIGLWLIYFYGNIDTHFTYFMIILILIMGTFAVSLGVYANIKALQTPGYTELVENISNEEKIKIYQTTMMFVYLLPSLFSLLAFYLYEKSVRYTGIIKPLGGVYERNRNRNT